MFVLAKTHAAVVAAKDMEIAADHQLIRKLTKDRDLKQDAYRTMCRQLVAEQEECRRPPHPPRRLHRTPQARGRRSVRLEQGRCGVMVVDHTAPFHDGLCRCTKCKPGMVGDRSGSLLRVKVGTLGLGVAAVALIAARATGAV